MVKHVRSDLRFKGSGSVKSKSDRQKRQGDTREDGVSGFSRNEIEFFRQFRKPYDIQDFLNKIEYNPGTVTNSPGNVIRNRKANCFEGALFAACALRMLGHQPLIVDMIAENDDDHVVAIFKSGNHIGAVAKSNTTVLRYREPVYNSLRELVMSYFDMYFNTLGQKTMRSYSKPVNLSRFDRYHWMTTGDDLVYIGDYLNKIQHKIVLSPKQKRQLSPVDADLVKVCFAGSLDAGLYKPEK